nr:hypothetical protein [Salinibacterium sp.]
MADFMFDDRRGRASVADRNFLAAGHVVQPEEGPAPAAAGSEPNVKLLAGPGHHFDVSPPLEAASDLFYKGAGFGGHLRAEDVRENSIRHLDVRVFSYADAVEFLSWTTRALSGIEVENDIAVRGENLFPDLPTDSSAIDECDAVFEYGCDGLGIAVQQHSEFAPFRLCRVVGIASIWRGWVVSRCGGDCSYGQDHEDGAKS